MTERYDWFEQDNDHADPCGGTGFAFDHCQCPACLIFRDQYREQRDEERKDLERDDMRESNP